MKLLLLTSLFFTLLSPSFAQIGPGEAKALLQVLSSMPAHKLSAGDWRAIRDAGDGLDRLRAGQQVQRP